MSKSYDNVVFIGRFQPFHNGHLNTLTRALQEGERVLVLLGSSNVASDIRNPFSVAERKTMILNSVADPSDISRIQFEALDDVPYNDNAWAVNVQKVVNRWTGPEETVAIIGFKRDHTSFYLDMFPQWESIEVNEFNLNGRPISSTDIRETLFQNWDKPNKVDLKLVPGAVAKFLNKEVDPIWLHRMAYEFDYIQKYKSAWDSAPYKPTFMTADAVVVQSGHVLVVQRGAEPGRGLYALPGGFVNQNETVEAAMLRELREETKLKVPVPILRGSIKASKLFDAPGRSLRGRTITMAYHIELPAGELPAVKGGDDAASAKWMPLSSFMGYERAFFEDHHAIIRHFVGL
jgi:bifunctional NMN adenylyltransferase/nudix hydrolase